jgi:Protein-arginine deiminase (PAD)
VSNKPKQKLTIEVSVEHAKYVRIFDSRVSGGAEIIGPTKGNSYEFPDASFDKKELGVEATRYAGLGFDGLVTLTLKVLSSGKPVQSEVVVKMRVAPWIMFNHFDKPEKVFVVSTGDNSSFVTAMSAAATKAGVSLQKFSGRDRWMQDIMEFGRSHLPGSDPARNVIETPRGRQLAGYPKTLVSDDLGYTLPAPFEDGDSLNSGGNLECTPPFSRDGVDYPFGRMYFCRFRTDEPTSKLSTGYAELLHAQIVQKPIEIDTSWLVVGHVDEFITFVPAKNKLGFKLLLASPRLGLEIARKSAAGGAKMLGGREYVAGVSAEMTVADFLAKGIKWRDPDPTLESYEMTAAQIETYNKTCQSKIDTAAVKFKKELGLTAADIGHVPVIYIHAIYAGARADALIAGMGNMLVLGTECIAPKPFGPGHFSGPGVVSVDIDLFEASYRATLADCGLNVTFIDDWDTYHLLKGEVHCGTNTLRKADPAVKWWEFGSEKKVPAKSPKKPPDKP